MTARVLVRIVQAAIGAGCTIALAYAAQQGPGFDIQSPWFGLIAAGVAIAALLGPVTEIADEYTAAHWLRFQRAADDQLKTVLVTLCSTLGFSWTDAALNAYWKGRTLRHLFRGRQRRVDRLRLREEDGHTPEEIVWTYKKGAIGQCWADNAPYTVDLNAHWAGTRATNARAWKSLSDEVRMGLSYRDYVQVQGAGRILAYPIRRAGEYVGCVTLDLPVNAEWPRDAQGNHLDETAVWTALAAAAKWVSDVRYTIYPRERKG